MFAMSFSLLTSTYGSSTPSTRTQEYSYRGSSRRSPDYNYKYVDRPHDRQYDEKPYQG